MRSRSTKAKPRVNKKQHQLFAGCLPGLGHTVTSEVARLSGTSDAFYSGFDGRSDWVSFTTVEPAEALELRCAEDIFVQVGSMESRDIRQLAHRLVEPAKLRHAETLFANVLGYPIRHKATARVVARVANEENFKRTDLRFEVGQVLSAVRPSWRYGDPADAELWVSQLGGNKYVSGLRLTTAAFRQRGGRLQEREGALRPSVAAAMVRLAGPPNGNNLLDLTCGSGTVLSEAAAAGWKILGSDNDPEAVSVAQQNNRDARLFVADARSLPVVSNSIGAVVSNLPFGNQFKVEGDVQQWLESVFSEIRRVQKARASTVLLAPKSVELSRAMKTAGLSAKRRVDITLLGTRTSIWKLEAASGRTGSHTE